MMYSSRALTDPTSSQTRTTRHTSNCACNLRKTDHTRNVYSSTIATSKTTASTPDKLCPHTALAINRQLWLRQALSALNAETPSQKNGKTENQQLRILNPSPNHYIGSQTQPIPLHERTLLLRLQPQRLELFMQQGRCFMEYARHRLPGALRLLQSFPGHFDNELVAGRRVVEHARHRLSGALRLLQSFPGHFDNELVAACSPLDSRDAPDAVLAL